MQGRKILKAGLRWQLDDRRSIQIKQDPWLPTPRTFQPMSQRVEIPSMVGQWKREIIESCFNTEEARTILSIPLSQFGCPDHRIWHYTRNGIYSMKTGYLVAQEMNRNGEIRRKGLGQASMA